MDESASPAPHPPLPFNNLYLNSGVVHGLNKAWMYFFTLTLLVLGYVSFQLVIFYPLVNILLHNGYTELEIARNPSLIFDSKALNVDRNLVFLIELGMFVFAFFGFLIGIRQVHRKTLISVITGYEKFRFSRFWFAFLVWGGLIVLGVLLEYFLSPGELVLDFNFGGMLVSLLIMILFMPIQTGVEELVFRGYLIQGMSQVFRNGIVPLFISSFLFALAHMQNPEVDEFGWKLMFPYFFMFALWMGGITLLDEGLELAFGVHLANNMISSVMVNAPHSVVKTYSIFQATNEDPIVEIILWLVMATISFALFWYRYKWKNFKLILK